MTLEKPALAPRANSELYALWENSGVMTAGSRPGSPAYTITMPPPNVTGNLHMGHALTFTLQDCLIRFKRMQGHDVLWQPGTDHAGIATQMMVEKSLAQQGLNRRSLGREAFLEKVWEWKEQYGGQIVEQLRALGATPDWSRLRFTLDDGVSQAVRKVFVDLHRQGLIYRDKRLVNWDPKLQTAVSDLEVENKETESFIWHINYPVHSRPGVFVPVATTRPETLFGDTGVAVNPEDERYKHLIGEWVDLPLVGRKILIVGDEHADPEKGTGAVKITPAHDFNDFEVGKRHNLERINILDATGHLNENVPEAFRGLERFEARKRVLEALQAQNLLLEEKRVQTAIPYSERSGSVIEPWLTDQWYVDAATLAAPALEAVRSGRTRFIPENWSQTYFNWLENIQPWCISRQLWWGHRIPVWYGPDQQPFVALTEAEAYEDARTFYAKPEVALVQDDDVLDTWFSSALWPFSTLGWPQETPELDCYYPTDVLVTGHDIIFFWVARMMMMGLHFMKDVPFKDIYIHALVLDDKGQKMSKTKGNVIDPLELIDQYGADALRFTLTSLAVPGRDVKFSKTLVESHRNFATKLWNVARFCQMNGCLYKADFDPQSVSTALNRWIVKEVIVLEEKVAQALEAYKFNEASSNLYHFIWGTFCDWYIEFCKPIFAAQDAGVQETQACAAWVFDRILHILHPFMPYLTEDLWQQTRPHPTPQCLMQSTWQSNVVLDESAVRQDCQDMDWLVRLISQIRSIRAEMNVPAKAVLPLSAYDASEVTQRRLEAYAPLIQRLARVEAIQASGTTCQQDQAKGAAQMALDEATLILPLAGAINLDDEKKRLTKEIQTADAEILSLKKRLANEAFMAKAAPTVVQENHERLAAVQQTHAKLSQALARLAI